MGRKALDKLLKNDHFRSVVKPPDQKALVAHLVDGKPGKFSGDFQYYLSNLTALFDPLVEWGAWNERVLDLWFAKKTWWASHHWNVVEWAAKEIADAPKADGFGALLRVLETRGIGVDDLRPQLTQCMLGSNTLVQADGTLTSFGRWLDAHPDEVARLWDTADRDPYRAALAIYLALRRPDEFARRQAAGELAFKDSDAKLLMAQRLPKHASMDDVDGAADLAKAAESTFAKDPARARKLAEKALDQADPDDDFEIGIDVTKWLFDKYGDDALSSVRRFRTINPAARVEWMKVVATHAKSAAVPIVIECLVMPFDLNNTWGFMDYPKYVAAIAKILDGSDIAPYRERVETHFSQVTSKKVGELIAQMFSGPKKKTEKPFVQPKTRYKVDHYIAALAVAAGKAAAKLKQKPKKPVTSIKLHHEEEGFTVDAILLEAGRKETPLDTSAVPTELPGFLDGQRWDKPLAQHLERHGYDLDTDGDELPSWSNQFGLPSALVKWALLDGGAQIKAALSDAGIPVAANCTLAVGDHDSAFSDANEFVSHIQSGLAFYTSPTMRRELAALFFEDETRRSWLLKL